jgi:glycosyltransferase involved in cell wall biosynthesis
VSVLSTHFEGLPLVILEAMAQQTPVIATAVGVFRK